MIAKRLFQALSMLLLAPLVQAQQPQPPLPRTIEPPAVTADRDAQLVTPPPPSWGPSLTPAPGAPAAESKSGPKPEPNTVPPAEPKADSRPADPSAGARRPAVRGRRAVEQVLTPTPRILGSAAPAGGQAVSTYGPVLQAAPPAPPAARAELRGTVPATCTGVGCYDAGGQRLEPGVGNAVTTPQGQLCTRGVVGVQCF